MHFKALTPSPYLSAGDLGGPDFPAEPTVEIIGETFDQLPSMKPGAKADDKETKGLLRLRFDGAVTKPWIANKTNMILIAAMFGDDTDGWRGHRVTLCSVPVKVGPKTEPGIRVKGSPEIDRPKNVEIKFRGRKAEMFTLVPTGTPNQRQPAAAHPAATLVADVAKLLNVTEDDIVNFFKAVPIYPDKCNAAEVAAILRDLEPGGPLRAAFDKGPEVQS